MLYLLLFLLITFLILTQSQVSLYYAFYGFTLWYSKMIPSLLPFMILSGILIRMNLSEAFAGLLHPLLKRLYKCNANVSYAVIIGFLCGFPMGAKVTADLLKYQKITFEEARFLLAFNNNIGPVYFCSLVIPMLGITQPLPFLLGMYGIPLFYGVILRRTLFRNIDRQLQTVSQNITFREKIKKHTILSSSPGISVLTAMDESIQSAVKSILSLCGYMILFNTLNLLPHFLIPKYHMYFAPILEITGGLNMLGAQLPIYSLSILSIGGLSCIAQTYSLIKDTGLSIKEYVLHKLVLTLLTVLYYCFILNFCVAL